MIILVILFISSALVAVILNGYWIITEQNGYNNPKVAPTNGVLLIIFLGSLLLMGLTALVSGV